MKVSRMRNAVASSFCFCIPQGLIPVLTERHPHGPTAVCELFFGGSLLPGRGVSLVPELVLQGVVEQHRLLPFPRFVWVNQWINSGLQFCRPILSSFLKLFI